jgi:hypothetical protein
MRTQPHLEGIVSSKDTSEGSRACGDRGREQIMAEQVPVAVPGYTLLSSAALAAQRN